MTRLLWLLGLVLVLVGCQSTQVIYVPVTGTPDLLPETPTPTERPTVTATLTQAPTGTLQPVLTITPLDYTPTRETSLCGETIGRQVTSFPDLSGPIATPTRINGRVVVWPLGFVLVHEPTLGTPGAFVFDKDESYLFESSWVSGRYGFGIDDVPLCAGTLDEHRYIVKMVISVATDHPPEVMGVGGSVSIPALDGMAFDFPTRGFGAEGFNGSPRAEYEFIWVLAPESDHTIDIEAWFNIVWPNAPAKVWISYFGVEVVDSGYGDDNPDDIVRF